MTRYCTRCGEGYEAHGPRCPKCKNPEFSLVPVIQTKKESGTVAKKKPSGERPPVALKIDPKTVRHFNLDPITIDVCPYQPRKDFPKEEIQALGESMIAQGQLTSILVRDGLAGRFELIDGERRWRACIAVGITTIRADCIEASDADVRAAVLATALQRKELNAIEEARAFRTAIDAGDAAGPTELAKQLGLSQGHVSNRLRLLDLPESWQARVISREIPATHARSVARYKDSPALLEELAQEIAEEAKAGRSIGSAEDWDETVDRMAYEISKPIAGKQWSEKLREQVSIFKPTDEQREQLAIVEIKKPWCPGTEERATNIELWHELQAEHEAKVASRKRRKADDDTLADGAKQLTATEAKEAEKQKAEQFARRLYEWKEDWMRCLIADELQHRADVCQVARVLMLGLAEWSVRLNHDHLATVLEKPRNAKYAATRFVFDLQDFELDTKAGKLAATMFCNADGEPTAYVFGADLEALRDALSIDLACVWNNHQAGRLSEAYWKLHTKDQLVELAGELKADFADDVLHGTKSALVAAFVARIPTEEDTEAGLPLPKEILKAKCR